MFKSKINQELKSTNTFNNNNINNNNKLFDFKETQTTVYLFKNASVQVDNNNDNNEKRLVDDMKINLKIKENLIESINDSLVLKDAEIEDKLLIFM